MVVGLDISTTRICSAVAEWFPDRTHHLRWVGSSSRGVFRGRTPDPEEAGHHLYGVLVDSGLDYGTGIESVRICGTQRVKGEVKLRQEIDSVRRWVNALGLKLDRVLFGGFSSSVALTEEQYRAGAVILNIGARTTFYIASIAAAKWPRGLLPVGGDHITYDIFRRFRVPLTIAEKLKIDKGNVEPNRVNSEESITVRFERKNGPERRTIAPESLNSIVEARVRRVFELVRTCLEADGYQIDQLVSGVYLTGGSSLLPGIDKLAEAVFEVPAYLANARWRRLGTPVTNDSPECASAIGLAMAYVAQSTQMGATRTAL
jgi:cell division protein FtsA